MQPLRRTSGRFHWFFTQKTANCTAFDSMARGIAGEETARRCFRSVTTYRDQPPCSHTQMEPGVPTIIRRNQGCGVLLAHKQTGQAKIFGCTGTQKYGYLLFQMSVTGPPDILGGAGAAPGAPGVVKAARRHRQRSRCQARARQAYLGMWGDLESARGVWVTDVPALATSATPATGKAVSAAEAEAWCAKALPKQDKQTTMSKKREATIVGVETAA